MEDKNAAWMVEIWNWADENSLSEEQVPRSAEKLASLQELNTSGRRLNKLPKEIGNLTQLRSLNLEFANLKSLPAFITKLTNLESIDLSNNNLNTLPKNIDNLVNLKSLTICSNKSFKELPEGLSNINGLEYSQSFINKIQCF